MSTTPPLELMAIQISSSSVDKINEIGRKDAADDEMDCYCPTVNSQKEIKEKLEKNGNNLKLIRTFCFSLVLGCVCGLISDILGMIATFTPSSPSSVDVDFIGNLIFSSKIVKAIGLTLFFWPGTFGLTLFEWLKGKDKGKRQRSLPFSLIFHSFLSFGNSCILIGTSHATILSLIYASGFPLISGDEGICLGFALNGGTFFFCGFIICLLGFVKEKEEKEGENILDNKLLAKGKARIFFISQRFMLISWVFGVIASGCFWIATMMKTILLSSDVISVENIKNIVIIGFVGSVSLLTSCLLGLISAVL